LRLGSIYGAGHYLYFFPRIFFQTACVVAMSSDPAPDHCGMGIFKIANHNGAVGEVCGI
jgi:hypothetical protein